MLYTDECHATKIMYFPVSSDVLVKSDDRLIKKHVAIGEQTAKFYTAPEHQAKT